MIWLIAKIVLVIFLIAVAAVACGVAVIVIREVWRIRRRKR